VHAQKAMRLIKGRMPVANCRTDRNPEEAKKRGGYKALVARDIVRLRHGRQY
jgi:hypothetical protein